MRVEAPSYRSFMETSLGYGGYGYTHKPSPRSSRCQGSFQHLQELSVHRSGRFLRGRRVYGESLEDLQVGNVRPSFCLRKPSSATDAPPCLVGVDLGHALSLPTEKPQLARTLQSRPGATSSTLPSLLSAAPSGCCDVVEPRLGRTRSQAHVVCARAASWRPVAL